SPLPLKKAVWLTNVDSRVMNSRSNLATGLLRLAELGFNTIYPAVWQRGYTLYPSEVAKQLTGSTVLPNSPFVGRDLLAEIIELAQPLNIRVIPWFEYGLMVPPSSSLARQYPDLLMLDARGNSQRIQGASGRQDPNVWLNPCHDRVRQFMVDLIGDLVDRYPVSGIQLDDHFSFPIELGYDRFTRQLFHRHPFANWDRWRAKQLTTLLQQIVRSIRSIRPNCIVSISPNPLSFSKSRYLVDWQQWCDLGLIDELVLQVYRDLLDAFNSEIVKSEVRSIKTKIPTLIGILTGLRTKPIATELIRSQVNTTIANRFDGYACFFYETLFHECLSPTVISRDPQQLIDIFS
ncbi:glycoside hydrolase family 10 protein, partial [Chamaesiphon polymorphus]|uniref:glycoside hydrolase family 10 protein n=1 Tax=Chamaesiphon polymorphus TaxID=2107691 RepID=UPI001FE6F2C1